MHKRVNEISKFGGSVVCAPCMQNSLCCQCESRYSTQMVGQKMLESHEKIDNFGKKIMICDCSRSNQISYKKQQQKDYSFHAHLFIGLPSMYHGCQFKREESLFCRYEYLCNNIFVDA